MSGRAETEPRPFTATAPDGLQLSGELSGPEQGTAVLFLHGGGQSRSAWRGAAARLAAAGYRACAMDLRGHGDSDWSDELHYRFDDYVADLVTVIDHIGRPAVLVGASLGGHVALLTAARHPERAQALLLADVTPWIDEELGDAMRESLRQAGKGFATVEEASHMVARLRGTPARTGAAALASLRRHLRTGADGRFYFRWDVRLMRDSELRGGGEGGIFRAAAARLRLPILVMRAEHSSLTSAVEVESFRAVQPGLQETLIRGAGHMVSGDVNDAYADSILSFLNSIAIAP